MWAIYDVRRDLYWNERQGEWGNRQEATRYSTQQRDALVPGALYYQWRLVPLAGGPRVPVIGAEVSIAGR